MGLSNLGIFHTVIGLVALGAGIASFVNFRKINLAALSGRIYFYGTLIASLTALGLSKKGGFNPGHVFALFIAILVVIAAYLFYKKPASVRARYLENFLLSFSFFLSLIPTVNETLTRVPIGHPVASSPADPIIAIILLALLVAFVAGSVYQYRDQKKTK